MAQSTFFATFIGCMATEAFTAVQEGRVLGLSSKGVFLQNGNHVLFITDAPFKSPFNIYVPGFNRLLGSLRQGEHFVVTLDSVCFKDSSVKILIDNVETWTPGPPLAIETNQASRQTRASQVLDDIVRIDPQKGWIFLYTDRNQAGLYLDSIKQLIWEDTQRFAEGYRKNGLSQCLDAAGRILGLGGGLTPSGDDWLAGFFLYLERFSLQGNTKPAFLHNLGSAIQDLAFQKTTTISANRIMAARRGWAEEPFLEVIDTLFSDVRLIDLELVEVLVRFGHSSGVDTLLGIYAAIGCE